MLRPMLYGLAGPSLRTPRSSRCLCSKIDDAIARFGLSKWIHAVRLLLAPYVHPIFVEILVHSILLCEGPSAMEFVFGVNGCIVSCRVICKAEQTLHGGCAGCDDADSGLDNGDGEADTVGSVSVLGRKAVVVHDETANGNCSSTVIKS